MRPPTERELRALFAELPAPSTVDRWRETAVTGGPKHPPVPERWLRQRRRAAPAVAAAFAVVIALVAAVVTGRLLYSEQQMAMDADGGAARLAPPARDEVGVPSRATLVEHTGDLTITTPGTVLSDLLVTGALVVAAPDVTLRRVRVLGNVSDTVRQTDAAPRLTIEDCDLSTRVAETADLVATAAVVQEAPGLTVRRCRLDGPGNGIVVRSDNATVTENYFAKRGVLIESNVSTVVVRGNTMLAVGMDDLDGPITGVTVEQNTLYRVDAPGWSGSHHIRVLRNTFLGFAPVVGWQDGPPGNQWRDNVDDRGAPVRP